MAWRGWFQPTGPEGLPTPWRVRQRALEVIVALSLAFLVWLYIRTRDRESLDHVPVPVQVSLAPELEGQYDLEVTGSTHVVVSFVGPPSGIRELHGVIQRGEVQKLLVKHRLNRPGIVPAGVTDKRPSSESFKDD